MIDRPRVIETICHTLQREYVALLGQRGVGVKTLMSTLVKNGSPLPGMQFISVLLPRVPRVDDFKELFLLHLTEAISEMEVADRVSQVIKSHAKRTADFRVRRALDSLGKETTAKYLVIILHALAEIPDEPLKNFLTLLREYHGQMRMNAGGQAGEKLRFLVAGDARLWRLCYYKQPDLSPFNIAQRIFLDGLSYEELQEIDTCASRDVVVKLRDLTGGVPSLVEQAIRNFKDSEDLTPFFSHLQEYWNELHVDGQDLLKRLAEGSEEFPLCDLDTKCYQIPDFKDIRSPRMGAFWGGFLRVRYRQLAWRSQIHQAFAMRYAQMQYSQKKSMIVKVDLQERTERLEKAMKDKQYSRHDTEAIEEAHSLAFQTYNTELASILEMVQQGEKSEAILKEIEELASLSEKDWLKELGKVAIQHKEIINNFLIEVIISRVNHFLSEHFDVFLCHNGKDKAEVKEIGKRLKNKGIIPWLDEWELPPGQPWQHLLQQQIAQVKSAAVFVGPHGIGSWQKEELDALLREFNKRGCPVIPVFLISTPEDMLPPTFLSNRTWVDFRKQDPDPMEQLLWGITGNRSAHS